MKKHWRKWLNLGSRHQNESVQKNHDISFNLDRLKEKIIHNPDVVFRSFRIGPTSIPATIVYIDGLVHKNLIHNRILKPLMSTPIDPKTIKSDWLQNHLLAMSEIVEVDPIEEAIDRILAGFTLLTVEGTSKAFAIDTVSVKTRQLEEPITESLVRGPRIGFNENLPENRALIRRGLPDQSLKMEEYTIGKKSKKKLLVIYLEGIANPDLVTMVEERIKKIDIDLVLESGYIEQLIEDNHLSPFPQVQSTERPDRVISALSEGRVAILLDGTPFALIVPVTFSMLLQTPEDYYERWLPTSLIRILRFFSAIITVFLPSIYISFVSFHHGLIPTKLAISISATREGVPFPSFIEAFFMEVAVEVLREAGLRLPQPVGQTVGLVGGLVVGEAAVRAGIVSPIMVIIVAVTAISSFAIPQYSAGVSLRMLRFICMFFAAIWGLYGVILFFLLLLIHFCRLKSFGTSYIAPATPYDLNDWKDFLLRTPFTIMKRRPQMLHTLNDDRQPRIDHKKR
jgi:spore germination protein